MAETGTSATVESVMATAKRLETKAHLVLRNPSAEILKLLLNIQKTMVENGNALTIHAMTLDIMSMSIDLQIEQEKETK